MRRPYDHERDGLTAEQVAELFDVPVRFVHFPPHVTLEEAEAALETERPFVVITGGGRDGLLERAWWWLTWREELRAPRWALFVVPALAAWGVVQLLLALTGAAA